MSAAGWYRDPTGRYSIRYWDGQQWTDTVNSGGSNAADPMPADMKYVPPAPGTEATVEPVAQQPTMQVTQSSRSPGGTILAIVLSVAAIVLVVVVLLNQDGDTDDETGTTEPPVTTEATEAPPEAEE